MFAAWNSRCRRTSRNQSHGQARLQPTGRRHDRYSYPGAGRKIRAAVCFLPGWDAAAEVATRVEQERDLPGVGAHVGAGTRTRARAAAPAGERRSGGRCGTAGDTAAVAAVVMVGVDGGDLAEEGFPLQGGEVHQNGVQHLALIQSFRDETRGRRYGFRREGGSTGRWHGPLRQNVFRTAWEEPDRTGRPR